MELEVELHRKFNLMSNRMHYVCNMTHHLWKPKPEPNMLDKFVGRAAPYSGEYYPSIDAIYTTLYGDMRG